MQSLPDSLQTSIISNINRFTSKGNLDLSYMKELRILICDDIVNVTLAPTNLHWLVLNHMNTRMLANVFPTILENKLVALNVKYLPTHQVCRVVECLTKLEVLHWDLYDEGNELPNFGKLRFLQDLSLEDCIPILPWVECLDCLYRDFV